MMAGRNYFRSFVEQIYIYIYIYIYDAETCMSADSITLLHFGVVEHSLCGVDIAKLTSLVVV